MAQFNIVLLYPNNNYIMPTNKSRLHYYEIIEIRV